MQGAAKLHSQNNSSIKIHFHLLLKLPGSTRPCFPKSGLASQFVQVSRPFSLILSNVAHYLKSLEWVSIPYKYKLQVNHPSSIHNEVKRMATSVTAGWWVQRGSSHCSALSMWATLQNEKSKQKRNRAKTMWRLHLLGSRAQTHYPVRPRCSKFPACCSGTGLSDLVPGLSTSSLCSPQTGAPTLQTPAMTTSRCHGARGRLLGPGYWRCQSEEAGSEFLFTPQERRGVWCAEMHQPDSYCWCFCQFPFKDILRFVCKTFTSFQLTGRITFSTKTCLISSALTC